MNIRLTLYSNAHSLIGMPFGREYRRVLQEDRSEHPEVITRQLLAELLRHCKQNVPYYSDLLAQVAGQIDSDPFSTLRKLPVLTKDLIRKNSVRLQSVDLAKRKWHYNTSGGSTGEPVQLIQDRQYEARIAAIQWLSFRWAGRELGEAAVRLWGSERDVKQGSMGLKMSLLNSLTNDTWLNAFRMTPGRMCSYLERLNAETSRLIIAYAQAIYELAEFAEREKIVVRPQKAILTSADTLHDFMREKIEGVFQCKVFNRYGSREVGDIACECEAHDGLHVFPWGSYVEVVDDQDQPVPPGVEGNILVTSLANFSMPLVRYAIGDRGILSTNRSCACGRGGLMFQRVTGRNADSFKKSDGTLIHGEYFTHLLYFRNWVQKFQVIQKDYQTIVYKIVQTSNTWQPSEQEEIIQETKRVMGPECSVSFELVDQIPQISSGKYRYTISEVASK